jgi:hypothetical protein
LLLIALGGGLVLAVQAVAPAGVALYDGVFVQEPYRYLHPTGDQEGSPSSFSESFTVSGEQSPQIIAATSESPPQAQLVALEGALALPAGTTSVDVSITPVDPQAAPTDGQISGNVYRVAVADQSGMPVTLTPCEGCISFLLRAADTTASARLQRFANGAWADADGVHAGGLYTTNLTTFGDYALVTEAAAPAGLPIENLVVAGAAGVILLLLFAAALIRRAQPSAPAQPRSRAIPSKRKRPPKPPTGRTDR